jgi:hypothetical protein
MDMQKLPAIQERCPRNAYLQCYDGVAAAGAGAEAL